jgi:hypothetical protein
MITVVLEEYDRKLPEVEELTAGLTRHHLEWQYIKHPQNYSYRELEQQLESSGFAIIVIAGGVCDFTWVNMCIQYCWALKKYRLSKSFDYFGINTEKHIDKNNPSRLNFEDNSKIIKVQDALSHLLSISV